MTDPSDQSGSLIAGRYRLRRRLGQGAFGAVYEALEESTDRVVAVKLLHDIHARDETYLKRFRREAEAAAALTSPHVVGVTEFLESDGEPPAIVMEYLAGETLSESLRREGCLSPARALLVADQILSGLAVAHDAGIVHRDVKPGNIFLTRAPDGSEIAKIVDFGMAKPQETSAITQLTRTGVLFGTAGYISPEQIHGLEADARSDLFAVGVVLFRCLTGRLPFDGERSIDRLMATLEQPTPSVFAGGTSIAIERSIDAALERALAKHPQERFRAAGEMRRALAVVRTHTPTHDARAGGNEETSQILRFMARSQLAEALDTDVDELPLGLTAARRSMITESTVSTRSEGDDGGRANRPLIEEEDGPTRMSEPDGDLLAMLQRARRVDEANPDAVTPRRRREPGDSQGGDTQRGASLSDDDAPTNVRTDISVEDLVSRADAQVDADEPPVVSTVETKPVAGRRPGSRALWWVIVVVLFATATLLLWQSDLARSIF